MESKEFERLIENMGDAGCSSGDIERVSRLHEAGLDDEILKCLRRCRCDLIEELHISQRKLDCMDHIIRAAENVGR